MVTSQLVIDEASLGDPDAAPLLNALRSDLHEQIQRLGGVITIAELIEVLVLMRPSSDVLDAAKQQRVASVIARAAVETEGALVEPRYQLRQIGGKAVVACTQELAVYAEKLGQVADELADSDPLLPPVT